MKKIQIYKAEIENSTKGLEGLLFVRRFMHRPSKREILRSIPDYYKENENNPKKLSRWSQRRVKHATKLVSKIKRMNYNKHGFFELSPPRSHKWWIVVQAVDVYI